MKTICLTMIVKNESRIITRALASVKHLIDYWVICDTGSSDNTIDLITSYFSSQGIPGELHQIEWQNFGHNRSLAIQLARPKADYLLFMDADMEVVDEGFDKRELTRRHYLIQQKNGSLSIFNTGLVSTGLNWTSVGVTHEYYAPDQDNVTAHRIESLYFVEHPDGGCKADKFTRDIALLTRGLADEPENTRYMFYLANSYKDTGDFQNAIRWYDERIKHGGWDEEIYYAKTMKMVTQIRAHCRFEEWLYTGLDAFAFRPGRLEALYEILRYCRENSQYKLGYQLGKNQENVPFPQDILFVDRPVHEWKFLDELSVCAYWAGDTSMSKRIIERILAEKKYPQGEHERLVRNLSFSSEA